MIFRALDIETVPDDAYWTRGEPTYRLVPGSPAMDERPTPAREGSGPDTYDARVEEALPFPPPQACRVVAVSTVDVGFSPDQDPRYWLAACRTDCRWAPGDEGAVEERRLLADFGELMAGGVGVHLVTWNGRSFDLPVIVMRSFLHKLACGWYYANRDVRYRYSPEGHLDLMDFLGDYGASRNMRLGDVARIVGLPGKTGGVSGGDVEGMYHRALEHPEESDYLRAKVARYCLQDTVQTAVLFLRSRHLLGKLSPATHDAALETFRRSTEVAAAIEVDWDRVRLSPLAESTVTGGEP